MTPLIIDEAHERSLNIDFILGYLKQLLPKRPRSETDYYVGDYRSAAFSRHFGNAPVIEVFWAYLSGRCSLPPLAR